MLWLLLHVCRTNRSNGLIGGRASHDVIGDDGMVSALFYSHDNATCDTWILCSLPRAVMATPPDHKPKASSLSPAQSPR